MHTHQVRALAFHHEKGYEAQKTLALDFAGEGGRIATMEDIVHARLHSPYGSFTWWGIFITSSRLYAGTAKDGRQLLAFVHGGGPEPFRIGKLRRYAGADYDRLRDSDADRQELVVEQEDFEALIAGTYGDVSVIDLGTYKSAAVPGEKKARNRYTYDEARRDEIIRAFLGREADAFIDHCHALFEDWHKDAAPEVREQIPMFADFLSLRSYWESDGKYNLPVGYARVYPLTIERMGLYERDGKRESYSMSLSGATNSGIDDLGGPPYFVVGVRGTEPAASITQCFRTLVNEVKDNWPVFSQPLAEVPNDAYAGIKPDGSREKPYYLLYGTTTRILEDGTGSQVPEYRITSCDQVKAPPSIIYNQRGDEFGSGGFPYPGLWDEARKAMPEGANAIGLGGVCFSGGTIEANVGYYRIEVEKEPFHVLMKCGGQFFTQYSDAKRPTSQPHRLVASAELLSEEKKHEISAEVARDLVIFGDKEVLLPYLMSCAPEGANAMVAGSWWSGGEVSAYVEVSYYKVVLGDVAFRPFTELRADFDWQLDRRIEAKLLEAA